ncbi:MAG TPA: hypothetical protein PLV42_07060 [bacterium]|nr:hypothetical protein [bacterium]
MRRCKNCKSYNRNPYHRAPVDLPDTCGHPDHSGEIRDPLDTCADHDYIPGQEPVRVVKMRNGNEIHVGEGSKYRAKHGLLFIP